MKQEQKQKNQQKIQTKPQTTQQLLKLFRFSLQKPILKPTNLRVYYSLTDKQSGTGLFNNQRLLLFHQRQCSLRYYSKIPKGLPFSQQSQIIQGKQKLMIKDLQIFSFSGIPDKNTSIKVVWINKGKKNQWIFKMANSKLKNDWIQIVNENININVNKLKIENNGNLNSNVNNSNLLNNQQRNQLPQNLPQKSQKEIESNNINNNENIQKQKKKDINIQKQGLNKNKNNNQNINNNSINININNQNNNNNNNLNLNQSRINQSSYPYNQPTSNFNKKGTQRPQIQKIINQSQKQLQKQKQKQIQIQRLNNRNKNNNNNSSRFILDQNNGNNNIQSQKQLIKNQNNQIPKQSNHHLNNINSQAVFNKNNQQKIYLVNQSIINNKNNQNGNNNNLNINQNNINGNGNLHNYPIQTPHQLSSQRQVKRGFTQQYHPTTTNLNNINNIHKSNTSRRQSKQISSKDFHQSQDIYNINQNSQQFQDSNHLKFHNRNHNQAGKGFMKNKINNNNKKFGNGINIGRKWNQQWCQADSNAQILIYDQFVKYSKSHIIKIIDQLPFLRRDRVYSPVSQNNPFYVYNIDGISIILHYETKIKQQQSKNNQKQNNHDAPLIFNQETYQEIKRQFDNYHLIVSATGNRGFLRVPLCCYFEYKGLIAFCKAQIPQSFHLLQSQQLQQKFQFLQQLIKVKFPFNQFTLHGHPNSKYAILNNLSMLIPMIPNGMTPSDFFCKQFLINYQQIIFDRQTIIDAHHSILKSNINQFLNKFQSLQSYIVDTNDMQRELNDFGLSYCYLTDIYQQSTCSHLKKLITSQLVSQVCANILRSEMNYTYSVFPTQNTNFDKMNSQIINNIILDGLHVLINQIFSYSLKAQDIWRVVVNQTNKRYRIVVSRQDIIAGYLLSSLISKIGFQCQFKKSGFDKGQSFFIHENTIPRQLFINFKVKVKRYDSFVISPILKQIKDIIQVQPQIKGFETIVQKLSLNQYDLPSYINQLHDPLILYLANFVPFDDYGKYQHLDLYRGILLQPHNYHCIKISLLATKWLIKRKNIQVANHIFQDKCQQNNFWLGQFNPAISQFYDFFSLYYTSVGNYDQSIKLAKSSLVNSIKILNSNSLPTADKHYQLGNIFFKIGKKEDCLKQYIKTKYILALHNQTGIQQYGTILLKMALLYLNFGKMKDCVINGLQALKVFDQNDGNQQDQIETFQILSRAYQITRKFNDMLSVSALCAKKFNLTQNPKIFQKMIKIVLFPKISTLSSHDSKSLQNIIFKLQQIESQINYLQAFSYLHRFSRSDIIVMKKYQSFLDNISRLYQETIRRDLFRKHKSLSYDSKSQAQEMLVMTQAICVMIGYGFILGSLRQPYYD